MDPVTLGVAALIAEQMGLNPLDLAQGLLDVVGGWFGVGQCSDDNKRWKKRQAQALDNATLADLINGRQQWSSFSKGDCGKWFKAYAIEEALKRGEAAKMVTEQSQPGLAAEAFDRDWFIASLQPGGANYQGSANQRMAGLHGSLGAEDLRGSNAAARAADEAAAQQHFRDKLEANRQLSLLRRASAAREGITPAKVVGGIGIFALATAVAVGLGASKKKKGRRR